ncbi:MAG: hypothetical protein H0W08_03955 [Acidobacteria bacterium]|nr:hypothetical protein [Acidobacteriota bacterium]
MKDDRRRTHVDPTAEGTADQSTQENARLHGGLKGERRGPGPGPARAHDTDDVMNRNARERYDTPRRYENEQENVTRPSRHSMLHPKT